MTKTITSVMFSLLIVSFISINASTQGKTKGKIVKAGNNAMISVSLNGNGGTAMSSGVSKAFSFNPNAGLEVAWGNFGLGIDASTFTSQSNFDFDAYAAPLKALDFLTVSGASSNWRSTSILIGPSYTIPFGLSKPIPGVGIVVKHNYPKATLTLSVKGGVTMNETPDNFSVTNNVTRKQIASYSAPVDFKKNAFTLKPSANFSYWLSQNIALNANVQYAMQTGQTAFTTGYKDLTNVNLAPPLSPDQFNKNISTAPTITTTTVGPDKYLSAGIGITYRFGKKGWDGSVKGNSIQSKHAINTKGTGGTKLSSGVIAEIGSAVPNQLSEKGINEAGINQNDSERKGIKENGLKKNEAEYVLADAEVKSIAEILVTMRKGWDGTVKGGNIAENRGIEKKGLKKNEAITLAANTEVKAIAETLVNLARKGWDGSIKGTKAEYVVNETDIISVTETLENIRKGWDGSIKGNKTEYVANEADVNAIAQTLVNLRKGWDGSVKGNKIAIKEQGVKKNETERKGIRENGLKKNEAEYILTDAEVKAIAETLVTMRKGWDVTVKGGNIAEKKGIKENGLKKNEAKSENTNLDLTSTAQTLVNLARKGWDGTVKGGSIDNNANLLTVTETLENIRKGWDGSIKGNKTEYVSNSADVKAIAETLVNLRKGWDGSVKGNKIAIREQGVKKNEAVANTTSMNVPHTGKINPKNGLKVSVMGSGQTDAKGTPIIEGKTVSGSLFSDNSSKHAFVEVSITQAESGDIGSVITDEKGNFIVELNHDTLHTIALNGVEFGKIKLTERKGWDGSVKGNKTGRTYTGGRKNDIEEKGINENGLTTDDNLTTSIDEKRVIWGMGSNLDNNKINNINNNMPNRILMNLTVGKQTQGATFGEKVNAGKINVTLVEGGCIVLFPDNGFRVNTKAKTITALSTNEHANFGEKVNAGLHAAGGAIAQGASLLGGALPGGAIISAAVSSVSTMAGGAGGGAAAASYAKTAENKKKIWISDGKDDDCDGLKNLPDGDYEFECVIVEKATSGLKDTLKTQVKIAFSSTNNVLKTKHDTAKNSVNNVR